jgi:hypothetical protein
VGQSARVFKGEMKGLKDDESRTTAPANRTQPGAHLNERSYGCPEGRPALPDRVIARAAAQATSTGTLGR